MDWGIGVVGLGLVITSVALTAQRYFSYRMAHLSLLWPTVSGKIISANLETYWNDFNEKALPQIIYSYSVDGHFYTSSRFSYALPEFSKAAADRVLALYNGRSVVSVSYNPADPSISVLETGSSIKLVGIFEAGLALMGAVLLIGGYLLKYF